MIIKWPDTVHQSGQHRNHPSSTLTGFSKSVWTKAIDSSTTTRKIWSEGKFLITRCSVYIKWIAGTRSCANTHSGLVNWTLVYDTRSIHSASWFIWLSKYSFQKHFQVSLVPNAFRKWNKSSRFAYSGSSAGRFFSLSPIYSRLPFAFSIVCISIQTAALEELI